ncbi:hypothetical protein [Caulobacter rhizosphaerae]|jgi:hypothetical protein|uniref:hypothetical protein n=1 Tax=Caulobacter rhizosphaerae TaxID=2010972 RepID=UPI0013D6FB8A|nr:hypothetical protein [Caulobacter rhizosphaerae]
MDFVSWLLTLIGIGSDRTMHQSSQRAEAARLNAEVAGEAGRVLDIIAAATPRLTRRCTQLCGEDAEDCIKISNFLTEQRDAANQIIKMTEGIKKKIEETNSFTNWNRIISELHSWRANATRIVPWVQDIVDRFDTVLHEAGAR